jgi:uncharacterized membrane protein (DUF373 family)
MIEVMKRIEHAVTVALIAMLCAVTVLATVELGWTLARDIASPPVLFPGIDKLLDVFGKVLLVLIGIELLETMRAFVTRGVVRAEVVLTVAMIAMARKIIIIELDHVSATSMFGVAALVASLSLAYRVLGRSRPQGLPARPRHLVRLRSGGSIPGVRTSRPPRRQPAQAR